MEQMAAPIRQVGEAQLAAGQRGELTLPTTTEPSYQAAAREVYCRRGVTSGTAAGEMAEDGITRWLTDLPNRTLKMECV